MRCSHNDYLNCIDDQVNRAAYFGCDMLEVDVIQIRGKAMLAHGWRPFRFLCHGTLEQYLQKAAGTKKIIYIELKEASPEMQQALYDELIKYPDQLYLVSSKKIDFDTCVNAAYEFFNKFKDFFKLRIFDEFKQSNDIQYIDTWPNTLKNKILNRL